jgi:hypothetical protein
MVRTDEKLLLTEEFADQVRRHFSDGVWRSLFQERTGHAQFGTATRTVLCVEWPDSGALAGPALQTMVERLARLHQGHVDPCGEAFLFISFSRPEAALRTALALQRATTRAKLRMGLHVGRCNVAKARAEGADFLVLLGPERARAEALAVRAAPGTVQLSPDVYDALGGQISDDLGSCVLMAEFDGELLSDISLALPPDSTSEYSTFAGLGLV